MNLVPMAGRGKRFADAGYDLPKPLIPVGGVPMILKAVRSMPPSDEWMFICLQEHIDKYGLNELLIREIPNAKVLSIDGITEGQASTCLLAKRHMDMEKTLFIAACDNGPVWDNEKWQSILRDKSIDAAIWTFRRDDNMRKSPQSYGWVKTDGNRATGMSVKVPISDDPYNDHAVVGSFWFRRAFDFVNYAEGMISKNRRINNEFYVDAVMGELIEAGKKVVVFEVDEFVCWGTPAELENHKHS